MQKICGVDTSKAFLDIFISQEHRGRYENSEKGIGLLAELLRMQEVDLVVMEASGGVERLPYYLLWQMGFSCAIVNPRNVRSFADAMGYLEKTDAIDAKMIAQFAAVKGILPMPPPSQKQQRLSALNARVRQIISDITIQKQRLHSAHEDFASNGLMAVINLLKSEQKALSIEIMNLINEDPIWVELDKTFRSVKGVADRTIATIMADLPEIGIISHKSIAKLVGLAPIANDSGKRVGKRPIRGGRESIRSILFLVADIARRFDANLGAFRERLVNTGKPKMVIRIAIARKLLVILNAKARDTRKSLAIQT